MRDGRVLAVAATATATATATAFSALRAASHFLLLAQEKVTKEKGTPDFPPRA
jgi:hypothetical protein